MKNFFSDSTVPLFYQKIKRAGDEKNRENEETIDLTYDVEKDSYLYLTEKSLILPEKYVEWKTVKDIPNDSDLHLPLVIDTEFLALMGLSRSHLTTQIKGIDRNSEASIYATDFLIEAYRDEGVRIDIPPQKSPDSAIVDYLRDRGYQIKIKVSEHGLTPHKKLARVQKAKSLYLSIYAHFGIAELDLLFQNEILKEDLRNCIRGKYQSRKIEMLKRLRTGTYSPRPKSILVSPYIELPCTIIINEVEFRLKLRMIDTCALQGIAPYHDLILSTMANHPRYTEIINKKELLSQTDKENMLQTILDRPKDFVDYAMNDLHVYDILEGNAENYYKIYQDLDIEKYYQPPKLSIGDTVADIFLAILLKKSSIDPCNKEDIETFKETLLYEGSTSRLINETSDTTALNAKVFGGRCFSNRKTEVKFTDLLADVDIESCYGNGLRNQAYPIGIPVIEYFKIIRNRKDNNKYLTLRQWLEVRKYDKKGNELIYGLWQVIVSAPSLKIAQDMILSWFDYNIESKSSIDVKSGKVKILLHQIETGVITEDILEWINTVCSKKQKDELLDNLNVITAIYYPSYSECKSIPELEYAIKNYQQKTTNYTKENAKGGSKQVTNQKIPSYWYRVNLDTAIINKILSKRAFYKLIHGDKSVFDLLMKLTNNTNFGILCSPFFDISNSVCANNITARARGMCWALEKALNGFQSITDGVVFDPNHVVYPYELRVKKIYAEDFLEGKPQKIIYQPLDNAKKINYIYSETEFKHLEIVYENETKIIEGVKQAKKWLSDKALEHTRKLFPKLSVLAKETDKLEIDNQLAIDSQELREILTPMKGMYGLEIKNIYTGGVFHGTSNYYLWDNLPPTKHTPKIAFRSYNERKHISVVLINGELEDTDFYDNISPAKFFMQQLQNNPNRVTRGKVFKKSQILKLNDYKNNQEIYDEKQLFAGDTKIVYGLLREFSLSQFSFRNIEQFKSLEREYLSNKRRYGQSYEMFFLNDDESLNYELMVITIADLIKQGEYAVNPILDKSRHRHRMNMYHPEYQVLQKLNRPIQDDDNSIEDLLFPNEDGEYDENNQIEFEFNDNDFDFS